MSTHTSNQYNLSVLIAVKRGTYVYSVKKMLLLTPSQCQVEINPLSVIGSKHLHNKDVDEDSFTQCPCECSQEEVVQQGCHDLAGILVEGRKEMYYC